MKKKLVLGNSIKKNAIGVIVIQLFIVDYSGKDLINSLLNCNGQTFDGQLQKLTEVVDALVDQVQVVHSLITDVFQQGLDLNFSLLKGSYLGSQQRELLTESNQTLVGSGDALVVLDAPGNGGLDRINLD